MGSNYYIGLMSGTSLDGIDAVLVDFSVPPFKLIAAIDFPMPADIKTAMQRLTLKSDDELHLAGEMDARLGECFAQAIKVLLEQSSVRAEQIKAIGSHGQTIRHCPHDQFPFTWQIGDPNVIAARTGIDVVADFRRRDIAEGGQGAPLAPAFHQAFFQDPSLSRVIVNIGGIANLTWLPPGQSAEAVIGFDTGPGNALLDDWIQRHYEDKAFDQDGQWAASGKVLESLLQAMLEDEYFAKSAPKSTGKEYFNMNWMRGFFNSKHKGEDVQATLAELTVRSIADAVSSLNQSVDQVLVCGGGAKNQDLMKRLRENVSTATALLTTDEVGVSADYLEAVGFAWLAKQTIERKPGNIPQVTGAKRSAILGGIYPA